jgi:hypothetical protein
MFLPLVRNPNAAEPRVGELRKSLDEFYRTVTDYDAFVGSVDNSAYYRLMDPILDLLLGEHTAIRVLEYGCGRTMFPTFLGERRGRVHFIAQDVTPQNGDHLRATADEVVIGPVSRVREPVHLAFSTFVLEHVACPEEHLRTVIDLIPVNGVHVIFCPNYELPGYLCPSLRHLSGPKRLAAMAFLATSRAAALVDRTPRFWVNVDPAFRHLDWFRDADAVHLVSRRELEWWHKHRGFGVVRLHHESPRRLRDWRNHLLTEAITSMLACTRMQPR